MLIAIVSDTHDCAPAVAAALGQARRAGAERVLHCGDITRPETVMLFRGWQADFVLGNCDAGQTALRLAMQAIGASCHGEVGELELDGKSLCFLHGHRRGDLFLRQTGNRFDYVVSGHLHDRRDDTVGRTRCINPGALAASGRETFALLDPGTDALQFLDVAPSPVGETDAPL